MGLYLSTTDPRTIEHWIPQEDDSEQLVTIDIDSVWGREFARWETMVSSDLASDIASAIHQILRKEWIAQNIHRMPPATKTYYGIH